MGADNPSEVSTGRRRRRSLVLALASCALAVTACGSSAKPTADAPGGHTRDLEFANCMRSHGVPNFPDPGPSGGLQIGPGLGINPQSPAFRSAQQACARFGPQKGGPPAMSESQRLAALAFAKCMRTHGQPNFPDPGFTAPAGATRVLVLRGMVFAFRSGIDPKSSAFRRAAAACGVGLP